MMFECECSKCEHIVYWNRRKNDCNNALYVDYDRYHFAIEYYILIKEFALYKAYYLEDYPNTVLFYYGGDVFGKTLDHHFSIDTLKNELNNTIPHFKKFQDMNLRITNMEDFNHQSCIINYSDYSVVTILDSSYKMLNSDIIDLNAFIKLIDNLEFV